MALRRLPGVGFAILAACAVVAACGDAIDPDPSDPATGAVQVSVTLEDGFPQSIGGTGFRVRLLGIEGSIHEQEIAWPGGAGEPIPVPPGTYRAEIWTVYYSDVIMCQADRTLPEGQRCTRDETEDRKCAIDVDVESGTASVNYRTGERDWECTLAEPAAT